MTRLRVRKMGNNALVPSIYDWIVRSSEMDFSEWNDKLIKCYMRATLPLSYTLLCLVAAIKLACVKVQREAYVNQRRTRQFVRVLAACNVTQFRVIGASLFHISVCAHVHVDKMRSAMNSECGTSSRCRPLCTSVITLLLFVVSMR